MSENPPRQLTTPPDTWGVRDRLSLALLEVVAPNSPRAATLRWRLNNASKPRACPCGKPGTVRVTHGYDFVGSTPPAFWRCNDHADVPLTVPWSGGTPMWRQSREECSWKSSSIATGIVNECGCGTHVGGQSR